MKLALLSLALGLSLRAAVIYPPVGGGGPTNGITATTATNIAAYQALIATNNNFIARNLGFGTNTTIRDGFKSIGQQTNSTVVITNGGQWFQSAMWAGGSPVANGTNAYGGGLFWVPQGDTGFPYEDTGTPMAAIQAFDNWGGSAHSAISPWLYITAPNVRLEPGYGSGYGNLVLGNEHAANNVEINYNLGVTLSQYYTANNVGFSIPLTFRADGTDASTNHYGSAAGIIGVTAGINAPASASSGNRMGELWFQSLVPERVNGGYAQNGQNTFRSNVVFRSLTNRVVFDGQTGIDGTSKTTINGGLITNTDILTKIIGTDSNGKFTGATLSGLTWDGTTLTASGGADLWRTNAVDGTSTNVQGGVSVGANYIGLTNAAHGTFFNLLKTGWRWMLGGSGSTIAGNTNSIAGTNGSGFFVLDSSGTLTTSSGITNLSTTSEFRHNAFVPLASVRQTTSNGRVGAQAIVTTNTSVAGGANLGALTYYMLENASSTVNYAGAIGAYWLDGSQNSALVFNVVNGGSDPANRNDFVLRNVNATTADAFFSGSVTATNGLFLPQLSGIPSGVDLRSSSGNTNWVFFNLGGDSGLFKTNPAAASSYLTNWLTVQLNFVQGSTAGTPVSLTTATAANITSISLTPGTWDLTGNIYFDFVGATVTSIEGAISTTSATISSPPPEEVSAAALNLVSTSADSSLNITRRRVTITSTTTYYLVGRAAFSVGSIDGYGKLLATRVN